MRTKKLRAIYLIMDNFKRYQRRKFVSQLCAAYRWEFLLKTLSETRFKKITESNGNTTHLSQSGANLVFSFSYSRNCKHLSDFGKSTIPPTPSLSCQEFSTYSKTIFERWDQIFWSRDLEKNLYVFFFFFWMVFVLDSRGENMNWSGPREVCPLAHGSSSKKRETRRVKNWLRERRVVAQNQRGRYNRSETMNRRSRRSSNQRAKTTRETNKRA